MAYGDRIYRSDKVSVYKPRNYGTMTDFGVNTTLFDIIARGNVTDRMHFEENYLPHAYIMKSASGDPIPVIQPVQKVMNDGRRGYNFFILLDKFKNLPRNFGLANELQVKKDQYLLRFSMVGTALATLELTYAAQLNKLNLEVSDIAIREVTTEDGRITKEVKTYLIQSDEALRVKINREWFGVFDNTPERSAVLYMGQDSSSLNRPRNTPIETSYFATVILPKLRPFM